MMSNIAVYKKWVPDNALWADWAKPALFANMTNNPHDDSSEFNIPEIKWLNFFSQNTALIIDLPGEKSVAESLALAQFGYRPVPLYNGVFGGFINPMVIDVSDLVQALIKGKDRLSEINISNNAPPVFMLDSRRLKSVSKLPGYYDNRWCVFPQDMPSARFLIDHKINNIVVRTDGEIKDDLSHILCRYQEAGIKIKLTNGEDDAKNITVSKPSQFKSLFYRFQVLIGLSRNAAGGFGSFIPLQEDSGRHYGIG